MRNVITMTVTLVALVFVHASAASGQAAQEPGAVSGEAAIEYFRANERATLAKSPGQHAIDYFRANERATSPQLTAGAPRSDPRTFVDDGNGLGWGWAVIGATSVVLVALGAGASFATVRRLRGRPLAH